MPINKFPVELRDRRVILAEDDEGSREIIGNALKYFGLKHVFIAKNGLEVKAWFELALNKKMEGCPFDLMLTSLEMSGLNGLELIRFIRNDQNQKSMPILVMTENATVETVEELSKLGISSLILKPVSPTDVVEKICEVLQNNEPARRSRLAG